MLKAATATAALIIAVPIASSHAFSKDVGTPKGPAVSQANNPAATAQTTNAKQPGKLMQKSATGAHYKDAH
jgi:hypothetical protein